MTIADVEDRYESITPRVSTVVNQKQEVPAAKQNQLETELYGWFGAFESLVWVFFPGTLFSLVQYPSIEGFFTYVNL